MKSQKLNLKNRRNQNIVGILTKPSERESDIIGTAVLQHGYGGSVNEKHILVMQKAFLRNSFQVFNIDSPNSFGESDGNYEDARLGLHADDFEDVTNWVREQKWFTGKLLVSGHSMGGFASARYALQNPDIVDFVIPFAPVVSGELSFNAWKEFKPKILEKFEKDGFLATESKSVKGRMTIKPYEQMLERLNHNLLSNSKLLKSPVLFIVCENDTSVPPKHVKIFFDSVTFNNKSIFIIKNSKHVPRTDHELNQLYKFIDTWLQKQLKRK